VWAGGGDENGLAWWKIFRLFCIANLHFRSCAQGFSLIDPLGLHSLPFNMSDYGGDNDAEEKYDFPPIEASGGYARDPFCLGSPCIL
jgi:hypothetical protein